MSRWKLAKAPGSFDRTVPSEVTVEKLLSLRESYGITRVTDITELDDLGLPVHTAARPRSISTTTISAGKGLTPSDSMASALAEAIELDCCEHFNPTEIEVGTAAELRRRFAVVAPQRGLPGGRPLDENVRMEWTWAVDLLSTDPPRRRVLFPLEFIRQHSARKSDGALFRERMSEGLASGNVWEEAVCHATEELIERDAIGTFVFRGKYLQQDLRGDYRRIRLDTLPETPGRLVATIEKSGRSVRLLDITSDIGVATVLCSVSVNYGFAPQALGAGASMTAERAVIRAITEAAQTSTVNREGKREDLKKRDPRVHGMTLGQEWPGVHALLWDPFLPEKPLAQVPSSFHPYVDQDLEELVARLRAAGIRQAVACDVSDANCSGFAVVRVVIPELELMRNDTIGPRRLRYGLL